MPNLLNLYYLLATGFGIGRMCSYIPVGTVASFIAIPIWWIFIYCFSYKLYFIFLIFAIITGIYFCEKINNVMNINDHTSIVWDEFIGMWITLIVVPIYSEIWIVIAFIIFRIFDIIKPWPIKWIDRVVQGGLGIVMDDVLAGFVSMCYVLFLINIFY